MLECSVLSQQDINVGTICVYVFMDGMALCFCWSAVPRLGKKLNTPMVLMNSNS
jgi:hypothetical protein